MADVLVNHVKEETYWSHSQTLYKSTTACVFQGSLLFNFQNVTSNQTDPFWEKQEWRALIPETQPLAFLFISMAVVRLAKEERMYAAWVLFFVHWHTVLHICDHFSGDARKSWQGKCPFHIFTCDKWHGRIWLSYVLKEKIVSLTHWLGASLHSVINKYLT